LSVDIRYSVHDVRYDVIKYCGSRFDKGAISEHDEVVLVRNTHAKWRLGWRNAWLRTILWCHLNMLYSVATVSIMWLHYSVIICTGCGARELISFKLCLLVYKTIHGLHGTMLPFCSPFRCSWWFGRTQNKATNSAIGHLVWLVRSPGRVHHWAFVRHLH